MCDCSSTPITRRQFLAASATMSAGLALASQRPVFGSDKNTFSFVMLGDLHYDKLEHHDMAWLDKNKPADLSQIKNYSRITAEYLPALLTSVRETVTETKAALVLQVGDLVEGLCGNEQLAALQNSEAIACVRDAELGVPFVFAKGNHDITGDGAPEAFKNIFLPYLREQTTRLGQGVQLESANYAFERGEALFCFFDAYDPRSLDWLEAVMAKRTARHCFVVIHPPVVPYGARSTWHIYSHAKDVAKRDKLLDLLGKQNTFVLGGHIHKYSLLSRRTRSGGKFIQLAISSVISTMPVRVKNELAGTAEYTGDQVLVEPTHAPATEAQRRMVYDIERPFVDAFEYAEMPGFAVLTVENEQVTARVYSGASRQLWRTLDLSLAMKV